MESQEVEAAQEAEGDGITKGKRRKVALPMHCTPTSAAPARGAAQAPLTAPAKQWAAAVVNWCSMNCPASGAQAGLEEAAHQHAGFQRVAQPSALRLPGLPSKQQELRLVLNEDGELVPDLPVVVVEAEAEAAAEVAAEAAAEEKELHLSPCGQLRCC